MTHEKLVGDPPSAHHLCFRKVSLKVVLPAHLAEAVRTAEDVRLLEGQAAVVEVSGVIPQLRKELRQADQARATARIGLHGGRSVKRGGIPNRPEIRARAVCTPFA